MSEAKEALIRGAIHMLSEQDMCKWSDAHDRVTIEALRAALLEPVGEGWQPIETAPQGREMFVVKAFNVSNGFTGGKPYTSDPWCVWHDEPGKFARWPHNFAPTHWMKLAASPKTNGGMGS